MNKIRFNLLLGMFLCLGLVLTLANRPAGATPHQPSAPLLLPGDENWLPGFGNGFAGLGHADLDFIAADNQGGFYATGYFTFANPAQPPARVIHYRNGQWIPITLPSAVNVYQPDMLHVALNGDLYIDFPSDLLRWDGSQLHTISHPSPFLVHFLGTDALSRPYINEAFPEVSNSSTIRYLQGTEWVTIGTATYETSADSLSANQRPPGPWPLESYHISQMVFDAQNNLYFGGLFNQIDNIPANSLAQWDGSQWTAVPQSSFSHIRDLEVAPNNNLYISSWDSTLQNSVVAYLQNGSWVKHVANNPITQIEVDSQNTLFIMGLFTEIGGVTASGLAQWNGTTWSNIGNISLITTNREFTLDNQNRLFVAEDLFTIGEEAGVGIAYWNGTQWQTIDEPTGQGVDGSIMDLEVNSTGLVYAAGLFQLAGDKLASGIAQWNGTEWQPVGEEAHCQLCPPGYLIRDMAVSANDNLYIVGAFDTIGNLPAHYVAQWNGTQWSALGAGIAGEYEFGPYVVAVNSQEHVFAATPFEIMEWDGTEWVNIGGAGAIDLVVGPNDLLYGAFDETGDHHVSVWDGTTWTRLGGEVRGVESLLISPTGELYATGQIYFNSTLQLLMHWTGTQWEVVGPDLSATGSSHKNALDGAFDSAGNLYITGEFWFEHEGQRMNGIARWDGTTWTPLGSGIDYNNYASGKALAINQTGQLFLGGAFYYAGRSEAHNFAVWSLPVERCGLGAGGSHQFYGAQEAVVIDVVTAGTLDCVIIQQHRTSHPAAPQNLHTGYWWEIVALDANRQPAGGFNIDLTLPLKLFPARANDKLCLQTESGWDCASTSFEGQTITREGVTQLGVWAVETTLFKASLPIVVKR